VRGKKENKMMMTIMTKVYDRIVRPIYWRLPAKMRGSLLAWRETRAEYGEQIAPGLFYAPSNHNPQGMADLFAACGGIETEQSKERR
jgi:hypothetical protein